jgi:hypothetical protein
MKLKIWSLQNANSLVEIRVTNKEDIERLSEEYNHPILEATNFSKRDNHNFQLTKTHSFLAVIINNVIYKFVYDINYGEGEINEPTTESN